MAVARENSLRNLLESMHVAHRKDIYDYSGGHLNESNLCQSSDSSTHKSWHGAKNKTSHTVKKRRIPKPATDKSKLGNMGETLANFSIGTRGVVAADRKRTAVIRRSDELRKSSYISDNIYVEEVRLPEVMLPILTNQKQYSSLSTDDNENLEDSSSSKKPPSQAEILDKNLSNKLRHQFVPSHLSAVTKKDQYRYFQSFETDIIKKQDSLEQNVLSGYKFVEHHEHQLKEELDRLSHHGYGPNFRRLQVYSDAFDDLITDSTTFSYIFKSIKREYDAYIVHLLESQPSQHQLLQNQIEQLTYHGTSNPGVLHQKKNHLRTIEEEAKQLLDLNNRLRKQIQEERRLLAIQSQIATPRPLQRKTEPVLDLGEQVEHTKALILEKVDAIIDIQERLRNKYVPASVIQHLEQCVKETEADNHKMSKKVEFYQENIDKLEKQLRLEIESADTSLRDEKHLWKAINMGASIPKSLRSNNVETPRLPGDEKDGRYENNGEQVKQEEEEEEEEEDSDDDDDSIDEEAKWSWYIS